MTPKVENTDFRTTRGLNRNLFMKLSTCDWIRQRHSLLADRPQPASVKVGWPCTLGHKADREDLSVAYLRIPTALCLTRPGTKATAALRGAAEKLGQDRSSDPE